jgi:hypothetical protein
MHNLRKKLHRGPQQYCIGGTKLTVWINFEGSGALLKFYKLKKNIIKKFLN